jgi:hypothetical protein
MCGFPCLPNLFNLHVLFLTSFSMACWYFSFQKCDHHFVWYNVYSNVAPRSWKIKRSSWKYAMCKSQRCHLCEPTQTCLLRYLFLLIILSFSLRERKWTQPVHYNCISSTRIFFLAKKLDIMTSINKKYTWHMYCHYCYIHLRRCMWYATF